MRASAAWIVRARSAAVRVDSFTPFHDNGAAYARRTNMPPSFREFLRVRDGGGGK